jgi:hypothetical protein
MSTEKDFWNSVKSEFFRNLIYTSGEFHAIPKEKFYCREINSEKVTVFCLQCWVSLLLAAWFMY